MSSPESTRSDFKRMTHTKKNRCDSFSFMFQNCPRPANVVISYHSFACTLCEHCTQLNQLQCHVQLAQEDLREHRAALACATCKHSRSRIDAHSGDEPTYLLTYFSTPFFTSLMPIYITKMSKVQVYALPLGRYSSDIPPLKEDNIMNRARAQ